MTSDESWDEYDGRDGDTNNVRLVLDESDGAAADWTTDYGGSVTGNVSNFGATIRYDGSDNPARVWLMATDTGGNRTEDTEPVTPITVPGLRRLSKSTSTNTYTVSPNGEA